MSDIAHPEGWWDVPKPPRCPKCGSETNLTTWVGIYPRDGWWCNNCHFHKIARSRYWDSWPWLSIPEITGIPEFFKRGHEEKVK